MINENKYPCTFSSGLKVYIHNQSFEPSSSDAIYVQTGTESNIAVKRTLLLNYPAPYSACIDLTSFSSDLYNYIINSKKVYRQSDCFNLCLQRAMIKACGCYSSEYSNLSTSVKPCSSNLTEYYCLFQTKNDFIGSNSKECKAECSLECSTVFYDYSLSSLEFPNTQVFNVVQNDRQLFTDLQMFYNQTLTFDVFKKSFVSLKVYYPYPQYTLITESPQYTNIGLFSSVGGSLGMFLGFSIFSVLEFVEVLIHIMKILIS